MQPELGNRLSQVGPHDLADNSLFENVSRIEHDLNDLIGALALLGVKRCSHCRQFFPRRTRRALRRRTACLLQMHSRLVDFLLGTTRCHRPGTH